MTVIVPYKKSKMCINKEILDLLNKDTVSGVPSGSRASL